MKSTKKSKFLKRLKYLSIATPLVMSGCGVNEPIFSNVESTVLDGSFECGNISYSTQRTIKDHILRTDSDGLLVDVDVSKESNSEALHPAKAAEAMQHIICQAEESAKQKNSNKVNILVYVHGGLNSYGSSDNRVPLANDIMSDDEEASYPVFLSWPSGPITTWWEHTFRIREGKKANPGAGLITAPFVFTSDVLTTVGKYPATVFYQLINEKDRIASDSAQSILSHSWEDSNDLFPAGSNNGDLRCSDSTSAPVIELKGKTKANLSQYCTEGVDSFLRGSGQLITFPIRYTAGSIWHSTFSSAAWDNMKRRAQNITYPTYELDSRYTNGLNSGAFFKMLLNRAKYVSPTKEYQITLIGHSMGTIVLNNVLTRYQSDWVDSDALKNIVYMAGAANIDDSLKALSPVLVEKGNRPAPNFYNLTLNRVAEVSETHGLGFIPTGSLLVSIDQHHDNPEHPLKRTIGSEVNVLSSLDVIDEALSESSSDKVFKAFDRKVGYMPAMHGDFGDIPFWRPSTWKLEATQSQGIGNPFKCDDDC